MEFGERNRKDSGILERTIKMKKIVYHNDSRLCFDENNSSGQEVANDININISITFKSQVLKEDRTIEVYLPEDYHDSKTDYPVLYVVDGQRYFLNGITFSTESGMARTGSEFHCDWYCTDAQKRRTLFFDQSLEFIEF